MQQAARVVDYLFFLICAVIGLSFVLLLIGAPETNAFVRFIDSLAAPLVEPFGGVAPTWELFAVRISLSHLLALLVYLLLNRAVVGLLGLFAGRREV